MALRESRFGTAMTALAIERGPPPWHPVLFLTTALLWGTAAGALLLVYGELALATRWSPLTVAWVHALTLGVLGNAILGSLLQFLPVVVGVQLPGARFATLAHPLYNIGVALLLAGLAGGWRELLPPASLLLAATLGGFGVAALLAFRGRTIKPLRAGIITALLFLLATVAIGLLLAGAMAGLWGVALDRWTDIHAMFGVLGWVLLLTGSVGCVTVPMFQGTAAPSARALSVWLGASAASLLLAAAWRSVGGSGQAAGLLVAIPVMSFALAVLALQAQAPHRRNPSLVGFWRLGSIALLAAALLPVAALLAPTWPLAMSAGVLVLAVALPALVVGMLLEIVAFLGWIHLHRSCGRGVRLPGVDALLSEHDKRIALVLHGISGLLLVAAALRPADTVVRTAGGAMFIAYAATLALVLGVRLRTGNVLGELGRNP